jgi:hypothetical protein
MCVNCCAALCCLRCVDTLPRFRAPGVIVGYIQCLCCCPFHMTAEGGQGVLLRAQRNYLACMQLQIVDNLSHPLTALTCTSQCRELSNLTQKRMGHQPEAKPISALSARVGAKNKATASSCQDRKACSSTPLLQLARIAVQATRSCGTSLAAQRAQPCC